jgi:hypothetical protein
MVNNECKLGTRSMLCNDTTYTPIKMQWGVNLLCSAEQMQLNTTYPITIDGDVLLCCVTNHLPSEIYGDVLLCSAEQMQLNTTYPITTDGVFVLCCAASTQNQKGTLCCAMPNLCYATDTTLKPPNIFSVYGAYKLYT